MRTMYNDPIIGFRVCQVGSMKYIVDGYENPVTKGYQAFHLSNGTLMGETGSATEIVHYDAEAYKRDNLERQFERMATK